MPQQRRIEIRRRSDGRWEWIYREDDLALESNQSYTSRDEAAGAARTAYPDVTVWGAGTGPQAPAERARKRVPRWVAFLLGTAALWRATKREARG